ncbi:hypothetical protein INT43_000479 [Umbelopsis isabellina]|uniref:Complex III subunit 9 n=1 Tax=Mortierella isabellina TaxID=91625 RepID=A0A8H7Q2Y5_MORIS|nr:hypothetical protein INT43_000479 [Umbelopsis isabellina]
MLGRTFYNTLVKKNSVFIATIFGTAFAFEVAFDTTSTRVWDNFNKGGRLLPPIVHYNSVIGHKQWKDIKDKYEQ